MCFENKYKTELIGRENWTESWAKIKTATKLVFLTKDEHKVEHKTIFDNFNTGIYMHLQN